MSRASSIRPEFIQDTQNGIISGANGGLLTALATTDSTVGTGAFSQTIIGLVQAGPGTDISVRANSC